MNRTEQLEHEGRSALIQHAESIAREARERHGDVNLDAIEAMLSEPRFVRYRTRLVFDAAPLCAGEFAFAQPLGEHPRDGFRLCVHPHFKDRREDLPLLIAYHLATVNYGEIASTEVAEAFGAALMGLDVEAYYARLCALADEVAS